MLGENLQEPTNLAVPVGECVRAGRLVVLIGDLLLPEGSHAWAALTEASISVTPTTTAFCMRQSLEPEA